MTVPATAPSSRPVLPLLAAVLAGAAHLVAGFFYLASGLVAPGWAVLTLMAWWVALAVVLGLLARRRSYWVLAVPVVAAVTWFGALTFGEQVLGWTP